MIKVVHTVKFLDKFGNNIAGDREFRTTLSHWPDRSGGDLGICLKLGGDTTSHEIKSLVTASGVASRGWTAGISRVEIRTLEWNGRHYEAISKWTLEDVVPLSYSFTDYRGYNLDGADGLEMDLNIAYDYAQFTDLKPQLLKNFLDKVFPNRRSSTRKNPTKLREGYYQSGPECYTGD